MAEEAAPSVPLVPFATAYGGARAFQPRSRPPVVRRFVPLVGMLSGYGPKRLRTDAIAGVTVAALALPASMAYAQVAGLPVTSGLYALLLPVLVYAFLGSTRWVSVGPDGTVALMIAAGLAPLATAGSPEYTSLAALLALAVGVVYLAARLIRLGWIAEYFSQAVLVGYITGVAILMILGQFGKLVGLSSDQTNAIAEFVDIVARIGDANLVTVAVAAASIAILLVLGAFAPKVPAALLVVVLGIGVSWALDLAGDGVSVTGTVPSGLPSLALPDVGDGQVVSIAIVAVSIFLVSYSDSILTARSFAARRGDSVDGDQELLAFSAANVAAGFSQAMPVSTSGSRTAVNLDMGATSQIAGIITASTIAVVLLVLTEPIQYLPAACLGAIIVVASSKLIDPEEWTALFTGSKAELVIAAITTLAVINIGVLQALVIAVLLSIFDIIRRSSRPHDAVVGWSEAEGRYSDVTKTPDAQVTPGVVVYRFSDRLFFANVHFFKRRVWAALDGAPRPVTHLVLDFEGVPGIDASAATTLRELQDMLTARSISLDVAHAADFLVSRMDRFGLVDLIGPDHFYPTPAAAVEAVSVASIPPGAAG